MVKNIRELVGFNLNKNILQKYSTRKEFAKKFNLSESQLTSLISGRNSATIDILNNLCTFLELDIYKLFIAESQEIEKTDSIDYKLFDEIILLVNQYGADYNIKVGSKQYLNIYNTISKFKTMNPNISTQDIFQLLKPTLETFKY
jgi:transcriptional regulator with XRE-family HTH domain